MHANLYDEMCRRAQSNRLLAIGWLVVFVVASAGNPVQPNDTAIASAHDDGPAKMPAAKLKELVAQNFTAKYKSTLMNQTYAPFVDECVRQVFNASDKVSAANKNICATYFDMLYNVFRLPGFDTVDGIDAATRDIDNATIVKHFCENFPGEVATGLAAHPFTDTFGVKVADGQQQDFCSVECLQFTTTADQLAETKIKPICKLILGGCRFIKHASLSASSASDAAAPSKSNATLPQAGNGDGAKDAAKPVAAEPNALAKESTNKAGAAAAAAPNAAKDANKEPSPVAAKPPKVAPKETDAADDNLNPSNINANKERPDDEGFGEAEQSDNAPNEQIPVDQKDDSNYDGDDKDKQDDPLAAQINDGGLPIGGPDTPNSENVHNRQSSAGFNEFREDPDSSFFSYFMFLMLVVIACYVAYHNKSKILALLIEGRRSRTYSSRNGSRRKAHSAEYRKLDSNLEEAIQSGGGGQGLSTQIIY